MNTLCINTCFNEAYIALEYGGKKFFKETNSSAKHSENLLCEIEKLLEEVKNPSQTSSDVLNDIDVLLVVVGPGSFTGLRIGIATAKAILVTHANMRILAINSLELIASLSKQKEKTAIIDGLSGFYFIAKYDENLTCLDNPKMVKFDEVKNLKNLVSFETLPFTTEIVKLSAQSLLDLSNKKINLNNFISEKELLPLYLRPSQAEANLNANNKWNKWRKTNRNL